MDRLNSALAEFLAGDSPLNERKTRFICKIFLFYIPKKIPRASGLFIGYEEAR